MAAKPAPPPETENARRAARRGSTAPMRPGPREEDCGARTPRRLHLLARAALWAVKLHEPYARGLPARGLRVVLEVPCKLMRRCREEGAVLDAGRRVGKEDGEGPSIPCHSAGLASINGMGAFHKPQTRTVVQLDDLGASVRRQRAQKENR